LFFDDFVQGVVRRCRQAQTLAAPPLLLAGGSTLTIQHCLAARRRASKIK
jgi:hypothetical protein